MGRDDGRDHRRLVAGLVAAIDRADLEQGGVGIAPPGVPSHRLDEVRQDGGPHAVQVRRDGVGQHQFRGAAAEPLGRRLLHEAPGHGFGKPRSGQGPAGNPHPALAHGQHAPRREGDRRQGGGGQGTVARDPRHFLDEVRPALDVPSPGGRRDGLAFEGKAQVRKDGVDARTVQGQPREGLDIGPVEGEGRRPRGCLSRQDRLGGLPAADVQDQPGRKFQAGKEALRVHAPGEAVLGVRTDPQGPARLGDPDGIEPGAFDEDVGGGLRAAGGGAAHHPAQAQGARGVANDADLGSGGVGLAIQGLDRLALAAQPGLDPAPGQVSGVVDVQGPGPVEGDQVGDVHKGADGPQPDRLQLLLQPVG